jgi:2',3'-cyclic-nucleotide 2'-phosphodiesterase/3'-nucleotidase
MTHGIPKNCRRPVRSGLCVGWAAALVSLGTACQAGPAPAANPAPPRTVIRILATTDLHGNLLPYDSYTARPAERGLAKIASLIQAEERANPNSLLIDCGDTIQGTPFEFVYQHYVSTGRLPLHLAFTGPPLGHDPMMLAMNRLGYSAMVLGNHEFNFGLKNIAQARQDAAFPWISANTVPAPGSRVTPFEPYLVKTIAGVKIAVVGITTPAIPAFEKPENYDGYRFLPGTAAAQAAVDKLRAAERPDLVIIAAHAGLERGENGPVSESVPGENMVYSIATQVPGIDAIVFGHTHRQQAGLRLGNVLLVQPKNWGESLAELDFTIQDRRVAEKHSRLIPVEKSTPADPQIVRIAQPYQDLAERYLNTPVTASPVDMSGAAGRVEDTALVDAIQAVQLYYAQADVSFASLFNTRAAIPKGPVTVRQIASLYVYDNQLYALEGNGQMVKDALENSARYFLSCPGAACSHGPLIDPAAIGFNYDMAAGVEYEIDLARPAGDRIRNLRWKGRPLLPDQPLRLAVNNYRAAGGAGYSMFRTAKIVWRSTEVIRDLMIEYYQAGRKLPATPHGNWRIVPPQAREILLRE